MKITDEVFNAAYRAAKTAHGQLITRSEFEAMFVAALSHSLSTNGEGQDYVLPCDVLLPPATRISKGCKLGTLMAGIHGREKFPADKVTFDPAVIRAPLPPGEDAVVEELYCEARAFLAEEEPTPHSQPPADDGAAGGAQDREDKTIGGVTWLVSEPDGGPDCGLSIYLGDDERLVVGEISRRLFEECDGADHFDSDGGWFVVHYKKDGAELIAKCGDALIAQQFAVMIAAKLRPSPFPDGYVLVPAGEVRRLRVALRECEKLASRNGPASPDEACVLIEAAARVALRHPTPPG